MIDPDLPRSYSATTPKPEPRGVHPKPRFQFRAACELRRQEPIAWLVEGLLPVARLGVLYGPPASGKSFLVLDLLLHIASDRAWQGRLVQPGSVAYVAAEGGRGLGARLNAWLTHHGLEDAALHVLDERVNLLEPRDVEDLIAGLKTVQDRSGTSLRILVLDTTAQCFGAGDENLQRDMNALIAACDAIREALGIMVLLMHHSGKDASRGLRGSSVLEGAADVVLRLTKERATGLLTLAVEKQKDGPETAPIGLRLVPVEPPADAASASCVVVVADIRDVRRERSGLTPSRMQVLNLLKAARLGCGVQPIQFRVVLGDECLDQIGIQQVLLQPLEYARFEHVAAHSEPVITQVFAPAPPRRLLRRRLERIRIIPVHIRMQ